MSDQRNGGISWTDATWNPIRGCTRVSEGCRNCYAERTAYRFSGEGQPYHELVRLTNGHPQWTGKIRVVEDHMLDPLHWRKPRRIFVNSMSDLFHDGVTDPTLDRIFAVMALCPQHTFQVLTKRPERMREYLANPHFELRIEEEIEYAGAGIADADAAAARISAAPLPNVWLGVSVENQAAADERIPLLLQTPAAVRWISAEPLLGPIDLSLGAAKGLPVYPARHAVMCGVRSTQNPWYRNITEWAKSQPWLDWVVVGGESGPGARPMHPEWARSLRDQCVAAGVAFHFKQWGEWIDGVNMNNADCDAANFRCAQSIDWGMPPWSYRVGKKAAGRMLDGREWNEYPAQAAIKES